MEDNFWTEPLYTTDDDDYGENKLSMAPNPLRIDLYYQSAQSAITPPQSSDMAQAHLGRQASDVTEDRAEKKRKIDKAYRQRCKEVKEITTRKLVMLTEENYQLKKENDFLKKEEIQLKQSFESQNVEMKQLRKELGQLKGELSRQNTVVEVLSNRLGGSKDINLLLVENAQLKRQIDLLKTNINNPDDLNIIQLQGKIAQLEHENEAFHVIIDALCKKINNEDHEQKQAV